jgi:hypothetical protein
MMTLRKWRQTYLTAFGGTAGLLFCLGILADIAPLNRVLPASADDSASSGTVMERAVPATPSPGAKTIIPAATGPSPEENAQKQLPPPAKPSELRVPTQADMESHCMQNPKCRQKLEQAKQGKRPAAPLPAATEPSPEEKLQKSLPPPAQGLPLGGPRSHLPGPVERFFSLLDPLMPGTAYAQTGFAVTLTPANRVVGIPFAFLGLYGGYISGSQHYYTLTYGSTPSTLTQNKPYVYIQTNLSVAGYYLIDVVAGPSLTKLLQWPSNQILETWDYRAGCGGLSTCHHVTVDYYAAGYQNFYFWADPTVWGTQFYSVTIKSYP